MRDFEKISFEQFKKDIIDDKELYENYEIPKRETEGAAGYDFFVLKDVVINPGESQKIPTGIKSYMQKDEVLLLVIRGGMGFNHNIRLCNQVGVIDADYYENKDNEGHIWFKIKNEGNHTVQIKKGEAFGQGIFLKYLTTKSEINEFVERRSDY